MKPVKNELGLYDVKINETVYSFEKWGAEKSLDVMLDIAVIVGKPLGTAIGAMLDKGDQLRAIMDKKMDPKIVGLIMEALAERFDKLTVKKLLISMTSDGVLANNAPIVFNVYYQDKLDEMFHVAQAALEVQYGNFLGGLLGVLGVRRVKAQAEKKPKAT